MSDTSTHLVIKDLVVTPSSDSSKRILDGITLTIKPSEVHAIMGPNGSGKTTLSYALMGHPGYEIVSGSVEWKGENLLDFSWPSNTQRQFLDSPLRASCAPQ
jgi:Fe-S cluster assembly ATP-binding protein